MFDRLHLKRHATGEWPSRSFKVTAIAAIWLAIYDFLLIFHCKYTSVLHHFRDINIYLPTRVSAAADRPVQRSDSALAKYTISHHVLIKQFLLLGLAAEYRSRRWVGGCESCDKRCRRPSDAYDTYRRTKLTAPKTISRSRDIVCAHQNLNGSRDLTTPLSGIAYHPRASNCHRQSTYQIWSLYFHPLRRLSLIHISEPTRPY